MSKPSKSISWMIAATLAICLLYLGYYFLNKQNLKNNKNPFAYNLDDYKTVNPKLINYTEQNSISIDKSEIHAMAVDANNDILISTDSKLLIYGLNGTLKKEYETGSPAYCITVAPDNKIYMGMQDHIEVYSKDGKKLEAWTSTGANSRLTSITIINNNLFAADYGNRLVWRFDMSGKLLGKIEGVIPDSKKAGFIVPSPYFDVAAGPNSSLWIANPGGAKVQQYSSDGKLLKSWGKPSMEIDGFSGCCNPSHIAIMPDGSFITSEKGLPRVKVFNPEGQLDSVVAGPEKFDTASYGCDGTAMITDIALSRNGDVLVLEGKANKIRIFKKNE